VRQKNVEKGKTYLAAAEAEADEDAADVNHPNFDTSVSCLLTCVGCKCSRQKMKKITITIKLNN
jgi:hypothetical protein